MTHVYGDGFTYYCDSAVPILYESAEDAIVDFERLCVEAFHNRQGQFLFAGTEFHTKSFMLADEGDSWEKSKFYGPNFLTIDEWFSNIK